MAGHMLIIHFKCYDLHVPAFLIRAIRLQAEPKARPNCRQMASEKRFGRSGAAIPPQGD